MSKLNIVDMFCGGGGESTGLIEAAHDYNFDVNMSAINHWERAIETHSKNYPFCGTPLRKCATHTAANAEGKQKH